MIISTRAAGGAVSIVTCTSAPWACTKWLTPERPVSFRLSPSHRQSKIDARSTSKYTYQEWIFPSNWFTKVSLPRCLLDSIKRKVTAMRLCHSHKMSHSRGSRQRPSPTLSLWKLVSRGGEVILLRTVRLSNAPLKQVDLTNRIPEFTYFLLF